MAETNDKNPAARATDDADGAPTSPFRRFPWVQLAFCVACLAMTAWTWMRYSYAWQVDLAELPGGFAHQVPAGWPDGAYVQIAPIHRDCLVLERRDARRGRRVFVRELGDGQTFPVVLAAAVDSGPLNGRLLTGRAALEHAVLKCDDLMLSTVHIDASRFHPASVAGIVVGAMGAFVFGLYLRRWLTERRATLTTQHTEVAEDDA